MNQAIILALALSASPQDAAHGHRPIWPITQATVTETYSGSATDPAYQVSYRVAFVRDRDHVRAKVAFHSVRTLSFRGQPWTDDDVELPIYLAAIDVGWDGVFIGIHDEAAERAFLRNVLEKARASRAKASELPPELRDERMVDAMLGAAPTRYAHWMSGAVDAPRRVGERRTHSTLKVAAGLPMGGRHETWFENDPAAPQERLLVMQSSTFSAPKESPTPDDSAVHQDERSGAAGQAASPAIGQDQLVALRVLAQTTFHRATLLPLRTRIEIHGDSGAPSRISTLTYEFRYDDVTFDQVQVGARRESDEPVAYAPTPADSAGNRLPSLRLLPPPRYPPMAILSGAQGSVLITAQVSPEGKVLHVELSRSSGWGLLDLAAMDAVADATFDPQLVAGEAVESWVEAPVNFQLPGEFTRKDRRPTPPAAVDAFRGPGSLPYALPKRSSGHRNP